MSFHEIPRQGAGGALAGKMSAAIYCTNRGTSLRLTLGRELLDDLGWRENDRLRLLFGRGQDAGLARLETAATGGSKLMAPDAKRTGRGCLVFSTQRLPEDLSRSPQAARRVDHRISGQGIEFRLPEAFLNETVAA